MKIAPAPATLSMTAICGLLGIVLAYEMLMPLSNYSVPSVTAFKMPDVHLSYAPVTLPPPQAFDAIDAHPLFTATRVPLPKTDAPITQAASPPPLPNANLVGIIIDSSRRIALIRSPASPLAQSFTLGDALEAWKIAAIEVDHVLLKAGPFEQQLNLNANRPTAMSPPSPMQQEIPQTAMSP